MKGKMCVRMASVYPRTSGCFRHVPWRGKSERQLEDVHRHRLRRAFRRDYLPPLRAQTEAGPGRQIQHISFADVLTMHVPKYSLSNCW